MPDATMAEVAGEVSGASTDLVERVLREYGDPAAGESDPGGQTASDGGTASTTGLGPTGDSETGDSDSDPSDAGSSTVPSTVEDPEEGSAEAAPDASETDSESAEADESGTDEPGADGGSSGATDDERSATDGEPVSEDEPTAEGTSVDASESLTEKERAVLEVVAERPTATQQEVADVLGVSRATVSKRASGIEGFDWQHRAAFVDRVFDGETRLTRGTGERSTVDPDTLERTAARADGDRAPYADAAGGQGAGEDATAELLSRLDRIETRLERLESDDGGAGGITDPELAHKVVHACMESEHVDEDEELRVVAAVLNGDAGD